MNLRRDILRWAVAIACLAFSPIAAVAAEPLVEIRRFEGHTGGVASVAFSPNGRLVVTASHDGTTRVWDTATGRELLRDESRRWRFLPATPVPVTFSPDGRTILTVNRETARITAVTSGEEIRRFDGVGDSIHSAAFSPDGRSIVLGSGDGHARILDVASGMTQVHLVGHSSWVLSVAFHPDGRTLVTGSDDGDARIWDVASGELIRHEQGRSVAGIRRVAFSPDGRLIVLVDTEGTARFLDTVGNIELHRLEGRALRVWSVAFSPDGSTFVTGSKDRTVRLWDAVSGDEIERVEGDAWVMSVAFSPDGRTILTGEADGTVRLLAVPERWWPRGPEQPERLGPVAAQPPISTIAEDMRPVRPALVGAAQPDVLAVVIGNRTYTSGASAVRFAHNDADAVAATLTDALGVPANRVRVMKDMTLSQMRLWFGTAQRPRGRLHDSLASTVRHVVVYYSGHGVPGEGGGGGVEGYILPVDGAAAAPEVTAYPLGDLTASLEALPVERVTLLIDACFSGLVPEGELTPGTSGPFAAVVAAPEPGASVAILSATTYQGRELAAWLFEEEHGAFTYHLLDGLRGAADRDGDRAVDLAELHLHVKDAIRDHAFTAPDWPANVTQTPSLHGTDRRRTLVRFE